MYPDRRWRDLRHHSVLADWFELNNHIRVEQERRESSNWPDDGLSGSRWLLDICVDTVTGCWLEDVTTDRGLDPVRLLLPMARRKSSGCEEEEEKTTPNSIDQDMRQIYSCIEQNNPNTYDALYDHFPESGHDSPSRMSSNHLEFILHRRHLTEVCGWCMSSSVVGLFTKADSWLSVLRFEKRRARTERRRVWGTGWSRFELSDGSLKVNHSESEWRERYAPVAKTVLFTKIATTAVQCQWP